MNPYDMCAAELQDYIRDLEDALALVTENRAATYVLEAELRLARAIEDGSDTGWVTVGG